MGNEITTEVQTRMSNREISDFLLKLVGDLKACSDQPIDQGITMRVSYNELALMFRLISYYIESRMVVDEGRAGGQPAQG